ncbi:hypothetical protein BaRGS_00022243, partial [Batillaria attramentaria]
MLSGGRVQGIQKYAYTGITSAVRRYAPWAEIDFDTTVTSVGNMYGGWPSYVVNIPKTGYYWICISIGKTYFNQNVPVFVLRNNKRSSWLAADLENGTQISQPSVQWLRSGDTVKAKPIAEVEVTDNVETRANTIYSLINNPDLPNAELALEIRSPSHKQFYQLLHAYSRRGEPGSVGAVIKFKANTRLRIKRVANSVVSTGCRFAIVRIASDDKPVYTGLVTTPNRRYTEKEVVKFGNEKYSHTSKRTFYNKATGVFTNGEHGNNIYIVCLRPDPTTSGEDLD